MMQLELLPLLGVQRDLYAIPRGWERFRAYLAAMTGDTDDLALPITGMNPMGKEHLPDFLEGLIALDAEAVAAAAAAEAARRLVAVPGQYRVGLVATDDLHGGWTNRHFADMAQRYEPSAMIKRGFIVVALWTSETWNAGRVRATVLEACYRTAYVQQHGQAATLADLMRQEGYAAVFAGAAEPALDPEDLAYTREVLAVYRRRTDYPTILTCLYGDNAAREVGYPPLGLSSRAGLILAREEAHRSGVPPEALLRA